MLVSVSEVSNGDTGMIMGLGKKSDTGTIMGLGKRSDTGMIIGLGKRSPYSVYKSVKFGKNGPVEISFPYYGTILNIRWSS